MHEIGLNAPGPTNNIEFFRPIIQELSQICDDTVYLSSRNGEHAYYLMRCEGSYPIRMHFIDPFQALHLVSCHSGRALLAALSESESEDIISRVWRESPNLFYAASEESLREEVEFIRENGFGWARDVTFLGVAGLTMCVPNPIGPAYMAVTITGISQRLTLERAKGLLPHLEEATQQISESIREMKM